MFTIRSWNIGSFHYQVEKFESIIGKHKRRICVHQKLVKSTGLTIKQQEQVVQYKQTYSTQSTPSREINVRNLFIHQNI